MKFKFWFFIGKLTGRKCRNCFYFRWSKGKKAHVCFRASGAVTFPANDCCSSYRPKWAGRLSFKVFLYRWRIKNTASRIWCQCVRMPIGSRRAPVAIGWQDAYNHETDSIDKDAYPECPYCGEMPHSMTQCQFCGQRFTKEDNGDGI